MKTRILFILTTALLALNLSAGPADNWVAAGRTNLANQHLVDAYSDFNLAVSLAPTNPDANVLLAATRILILPQQPGGSNFLSRLGFPAAGRDIYPGEWTSKFPTNSDGTTKVPSGLYSTEFVAVVTTNIMPAIAASLSNLASITDTNYTLTLTASETDSPTGVTLDYGDIMLLRALGHAANFLVHTLNADNFTVSINTLYSMGQANTLTLQSLLSTYPYLLTSASASASELAASKASFTNAVACYFAASDFIRARAPGVERLFDLPADKQDEEANFRDAATKALASLSQPVVVSTNSTDGSLQSVYAGAYFAGAKSPRSLLPSFSGNNYVNNSLSDPTFGGILLGEPKCDIEALLRQKLNPTYAGVYRGGAGGGNSGYGYGKFLLYVGPNNQATLMGEVMDASETNGLFGQFTVEQGGSWSFSTNNIEAWGNVSKDGSVDGNLYCPLGWFWLNGYLPPNNPSFQNQAGYYSGSASGSGGGGRLQSVLDAAGDFGFVEFDSGSVVPTDGGGGVMDSSTRTFSVTSTQGTIVRGQLNPATPSITGTWSNSPTEYGTFNMPRAGIVTPDTAPTLQAPLPAQVLAQTGQNVTFTVHAAGSAPLCYQWYANGAVVGGATTSSLVVSNVQLQANGTPYSVLVRNVAGSTTAASTLVVGCETNPPTLKITSPSPGQSVSNAQFVVAGTAQDNVQVSNVMYQLNGTGWNLASSANNWTNWTAGVTLTAGTNVVQAYAVDTCGNLSQTVTSRVVYVLSDRLVLVTNPPAGGSVSGVANGQWLAINQSYTATALSNGTGGYVFTSWVISTNGTAWATSTVPALTFTMQSNLTLVASFADVQKPTLAITNPAAGIRVSNAVVDVKGWARDNAGVTNVAVSLNGGSFMPATTQNNWTNWVLAAQTLEPGTNVLRAYAADTSGNLSQTVTSQVIYVLSDRLVLVTNPPAGGSVSGVANGQWLEINRSYTATALSNGTGGYVFTSWVQQTNGTAWATSTVPALTFTMQSNLTLVASFADVQKPTLAITNPAAGIRVSNAVVDVKGWARDNAGVTNVSVSLNGGSFTPATTQNNWTNWVLAAQTLEPGTNWLRAYAADTCGNLSQTVTSQVIYVLSDRLVLVTNPPAGGSVSGVANGQWLEINRSYTATALSNGTGGYVFTSWVQQTNGTAWATSTVPALTFTMQSNLTLVASFADVQKPTLAITNPAAGIRVSNAVVDVKGWARDNAGVTNVSVSLNGGSFMPATTQNNWTNWVLAAQMLEPGTNVLRAYAADTSGNLSQTVTGQVIYVLSDRLVLVTNPPAGGSVSGVANGQWLEINRSYTATALSNGTGGYVFTSWVQQTNGTAWATSTVPALTFTMQSNLTLVASFADVQKPTLAITNPAAGIRVSNAVVDVKGWARDNAGVTNVSVSLNGGSSIPATTQNNWTNWVLAAQTLEPGTNVLRAYAADTSGNLSQTVTSQVIYVLSDRLVLVTNPPAGGSVSGVANGQWLEINRSYTATALSNGTGGYVFTSWVQQTNGTAWATSTVPALTFTMQSNLTLVASFADVRVPTLLITSPYAGQKCLGNTSFTLTGTAADNVQVSNVWCKVTSNSQVPTTGWQKASGTTNWTAPVTLTPGTNWVWAYAVDTSGNLSKTNSVQCVYVVTAQVFVNRGGTGIGTWSPNYNGQWLQIGQNYAMTATAGSGCYFTNWTGSNPAPTNAATLNFTMAPNLAFTANFVDKTPPTLVISSPSASQQWLGGAQFAVKGTAADNVQVAQVMCQVTTNSLVVPTSGWVSANGTTNWTAGLPLTPGANTAWAFAVDASGQYSRTNSVTFTYLVSAPLMVSITGKGTVSPNYTNGQWLQIGTKYSMTAIPASGCVFTNWTGSTNTSAPTLTFIMASNLTFTANFVDRTRPTVTITSPRSGAQPTNVTLTASGTAGDNVQLAGVYWNLNNSGWNPVSTTNNWTNWTAGLTLAPGPNTLAVYAADEVGTPSLTNFVSFFCLTNLLQTYWPMHDGDWKTFSGLITPVDMSFTNQPDGSFVQQVNQGGEEVDSHYQYGNTNTQVLLSEENAAGDDMTYSPFIVELDATHLLNGGTWQVPTIISLADGQFPATAAVTVSSIGNTITVPAGTFPNCVTVPAGTYPYCKNVTITLTVSVPGIGNIPLSESAYVLAPGVGQIKIGYYQPSSSSGFSFLGWDSMTDGVINGVNVTNLTQSALAP